MKTKTKDFHIYLPAELAERVRECADAECRSVNQQITYFILAGLKTKKSFHNILGNRYRAKASYGR